MDNGEINAFEVRKGLQIAAKSATMFRGTPKGINLMGAIRKTRSIEVDDSVFDDADALFALAQRAFDRAAKAEVAKNDALGIPTHGSVGGKLVVRQPPKVRHSSQP